MQSLNKVKWGKLIFDFSKILKDGCGIDGSCQSVMYFQSGFSDIL